MFRPDRRTPPPGRVATRWFLFLTFFHLLPVPWWLAVAAGLAPASFLLLGGLASLFNSDSDSLAFAALLLAPALVAGLVIALLALLLAAAIGKVKRPLVRTLTLLALLAGGVAAALLPIYLTGSHSGGEALSLLDFFRLLDDYRVPRAAAVGYCSGLLLLLGLLLVMQHRPQSFPALPPRLGRRVSFAVLIFLVASLIWGHRVMLVIYPLAELGFASQQYRLAKTISADSGSAYRTGSDSRKWLIRAAEQGHQRAALDLAEHPLSAEDKLHWLTLAAEGGLAKAQYQLYRLLLRGGADGDSASAGKWLQAAAAGGDPLAQYDLGKACSNGDEALGIGKAPARARKLWEQAASQGQAQAAGELAYRYHLGAAGFKRDPQRAIELYQQLAELYASGSIDLRPSPQMAAGARQQAEQIAALEQRVAQGDSAALFELGRQLIDAGRDNPQTVAEGFALLEQAAESGHSEVRYFLGAVFMFGNYGQPKDPQRGRHWWDRAAELNHVKAMEYLAKAYQGGTFGVSVDLLKAKALTAKLVEAYRDGRYGVDPDPQQADYWSRELKYFDRLFDIAGGSYQPLDTLRSQAESGDAAAQYQLGRQLLVSGAAADRQQGLELIEQAAAAGDAEAQYRLVSYFENNLHIMRDDPERGVALLTAAAEQNHLPAMAALAIAYSKGRYGLPQDYRQAKTWYQRLLAVHAGGRYLGEIDERFLAFQQRQLDYAERALAAQLLREERIANASPIELQIIAIEDRHRKEYERAVNALDRRDGSREGMARFRAEVERLRQHSLELREQEIQKLKRAAAD
ncbi:tetratricopeptide repeat protein [Trichloromonas sp.]|uniref:tetratricopeptide repeat protein n=1 Tax=Trichloromonas sp. TaxID=3069249 RepID=UPI003D818B86